VYDLTKLPASLTLTADNLGRAQVRCECCGGREWLDSGKAIRHSRRCDTKAQLAFAKAVAAPIVAKSSKIEVADLRRSLPQGANVCEQQDVDTVVRWVRDGAVSQSEAMNLDF
jgi:hypothetical protein